MFYKPAFISALLILAVNSFILLNSHVTYSIDAERKNSSTSSIIKQKAASEKKFHYRIKPVPLEDRVNLDITVSFEGSSTGKTDILLPLDRYGTRDLFNAVASFEVKNGVATTVFEKPYLRKVHHEPNAQLEINYTLSVDPELTKTSSFSPVIESDIFHFFWPQWTLRLPGDSLTYNYSIEFFDVPTSWVSLASLPQNDKGIYEISTAQDEFKPLIIGGNYDYFTVDIDGNRVEIAISYHFRDENLLADVSKLLTFQRQFFGFNSDAPFLVSVTKRDGMLGGTAMDNAFVLLLRKGADKPDVLSLLTHEIFHNWIPQKASLYVDPNETGSEFKSEFFSEGFADYVPKVILNQEDLISKLEVTELLNDTFLAYAKNPVTTISFEEMQKVINNGGYNYLYEKVSYYRGDLIAFKWDNVIRSYTNNEENILHFVRKIILSAEKTEGVITFERFFNIAAEYGIDAKRDWEKYILNGEKIEIDELGWLSDNFKLISLEERFYDAGFKVNQSEREGVIDGVVEGNTAYKAGLRNGMTIKKMVVSKDKETEMYLLISLDNNDIEIRYYPFKEVEYQKIIKKD